MANEVYVKVKHLEYVKLLKTVETLTKENKALLAEIKKARKSAKKEVTE